MSNTTFKMIVLFQITISQIRPISPMIIFYQKGIFLDKPINLITISRLLPLSLTEPLAFS